MRPIAIPTPDFQDFRKRISNTKTTSATGRVVDIVGLVAESNGPNSRIGDLCLIGDERNGAPVQAEVVGFRGERVLLMPLGEMKGVRSGTIVRASGGCLRVPVGEHLLGRVLDALGRPIDGDVAGWRLAVSGGPRDDMVGGEGCTYPLSALPPHPLDRNVISRPFVTGVRALDGLLSMGIGQRMGIFSGSGIGKSTLLGMIARHGSAHVNVIALVGERGREVREFMENDLGSEGLKRSVVVCATSDQPAMLRIKAAMTATAIAEYFRDHGLDVLLLMDSVTRFATAQREVGLAVGEPPSTKGYTPSVFAMLPKLMERAGCSDKGSITAIYTILVEGDDTNEPIADATRAILDGHIVLDRRLTNQGHYPPINVLQSLSRVMPMVAGKERMQRAAAFRELASAYGEVEELINIGAYKSGSNLVADRAIAKRDDMSRFLRQDKDAASTMAETDAALEGLTNG